MNNQLKVNATIVTIGDELLIGQTIDTNSAFIAVQLNSIGVNVHRKIAIGDEWKSIWETLKTEEKNAEIIIITGGLGPTSDDITKQLLCKYFNSKLVMHKPSLKQVKKLFLLSNLPLLEVNCNQALVPEVATVLFNHWGTAPGLMFKKNKKLFFALPGVPFEMQQLILKYVLPKIKKEFRLPVIEHKTLVTMGISESFLSKRLIEFESKLPQHIKLAYLPDYNMVKLRLTSFGTNNLTIKKEINSLFTQLKKLVTDVKIADEDVGLAKIVGNLLLNAHKTVGTAESCTGGFIAHLITSISGASEYFKGGIVCYSNELKKKYLKVNHQILEKEGAVSESTVIQMAKGALRFLNTDFSIAVSGIMGPNGGSPDKPVGLVWVAVATKNKHKTKKIKLRFDREKNIRSTSIAALNLLRELILEN